MAPAIASGQVERGECEAVDTTFADQHLALHHRTVGAVCRRAVHDRPSNPDLPERRPHRHRTVDFVQSDSIGRTYVSCTSDNGISVTATLTTAGADLVVDTWYHIAVDKDCDRQGPHLRQRRDESQQHARQQRHRVHGLQPSIVGSSGAAASKARSRATSTMSASPRLSRYGDLYGDAGFTLPGCAIPGSRLMPGSLDSCINNIYEPGNIPASSGTPPVRVVVAARHSGRLRSGGDGIFARLHEILQQRLSAAPDGVTHGRQRFNQECRRADVQCGDRRTVGHLAIPKVTMLAGDGSPTPIDPRRLTVLPARNTRRWRPRRPIRCSARPARPAI